MTIEEALAEIEKLGRRGRTKPSVAEEEVSCRDTQQAVGFWPRLTSTFGGATLFTPTGGGPASHRHPRVCRQVDGSRAGADYSAARSRVHGTVAAHQHVFWVLRIGA